MCIVGELSCYMKGEILPSDGLRLFFDSLMYDLSCRGKSINNSGADAGGVMDKTDPLGPVILAGVFINLQVAHHERLNAQVSQLLLGWSFNSLLTSVSSMILSCL